MGRTKQKRFKSLSFINYCCETLEREVYDETKKLIQKMRTKNNKERADKPNDKPRNKLNNKLIDRPINIRINKSLDTANSLTYTMIRKSIEKQDDDQLIKSPYKTQSSIQRNMKIIINDDDFKENREQDMKSPSTPKKEKDVNQLNNLNVRDTSIATKKTINVSQKSLPFRSHKSFPICKCFLLFGK